MLPDYSHLCRVREGWQRQPIRFTAQDDERCKADTAFEWTESLLDGDQAAVPPLQLKILMGGLATDWMWSADVAVIVISQRLVDIMVAERLTGWSTYAVDCRDRSGQRLVGQQYHGLAITGRAGARDLARGIVVDKPPIVPQGKPYQVLRGLFFQNDAWDGSDFCLVCDTLIIVATGRVADIFKEQKIRNVVFTPLDSYEEDIGGLRTLGLWPPPTRDGMSSDLTNRR